QHGWATAETIGLLAASAALIGAFFLIELRSKAPLLPLRIFRLRTLSGSNLSGLLMGGAIFSQFFLLTLYMQQVLHYSALKTGVAIGVAAATTIATTFTTHYVNAHVGTSAFSGAALTHGFEIAFYVLAVVAALGALLAALLLESRPAQAEPELTGEAVLELEAAA